MLGLLGAGNDVDRNIGRVRVVAQQVEQDEPVDIRQAKVQRDRTRPHLADHRDRALTRPTK